MPSGQLLHYKTIMDNTVYTNENASFLTIAAIGIYMISGNESPMTRGVIALNSFVLPDQ